MEVFSIFLFILLIMILFMHNPKKECIQSHVWIGGPSSHVPKPMARWGFPS